MGCAGTRSPIRGSPTLQFTGLKGSTANMLVPDTTGHFLRSCRVHTLTGQSCCNSMRRTSSLLSKWSQYFGSLVYVCICVYIPAFRPMTAAICSPPPWRGLDNVCVCMNFIHSWHLGLVLKHLLSSREWQDYLLLFGQYLFNENKSKSKTQASPLTTRNSQ